ncbi:hypothetical protein H8C17_002588 [Salmonella enterica]|nr:hypothetical protein [Salmonella enterica]
MSNYAASFPWLFALFVVGCVCVFVKNSSKKKGSKHNLQSAKNHQVSSGVILKYELLPVQTNILMLPETAQILSVKGGEDNIYVWAVVPELKENVKRKFVAIPTGDNVPDKSIYIDTAFVDKMVFHVFELN